MKLNDVKKSCKGYIKRYGIEFRENRLLIFKPEFIAIPYERLDSVKDRNNGKGCHTLEIDFNMGHLTLWKTSTITHLGIYP